MSPSDMDLGQLFNFYGTDKDHVGYTSLYHALFHSRRHDRLTLLEIGIGTLIPAVHSSMRNYALPGYTPGGSLRAWRDYFRSAQILGIDVQPDTQFAEERIATFHCDSTDSEQVTALFERLNGTMIDIVIDDGSHIDTNQLKTLENFYRYLSPGGFYVMEDVNAESRLLAHPEMLEPICDGDPYFFVGIQNTMCVIFKSHLQRGASPYNY